MNGYRQPIILKQNINVFTERFQQRTDKLVNLIQRCALFTAIPLLRYKLEQVCKHCHTSQCLWQNWDYSESSTGNVHHINQQKINRTQSGLRNQVLCSNPSSRRKKRKFVGDIFIFLGYKIRRIRDKVKLDHVPQFQSENFKEYLSSAIIPSRKAGMKGHNALGQVEGYHAFLRSLHNKVQSEYPHMNPQIVLRVDTKACKDTSSPNRLFPTLLVSNIVSWKPIN